MNITLTGGDILGWYKFDDIYDFSNNIDSAVYSFGLFDKVPDNKILPANTEEVLYIGQTGGQEKIFDKKDKTGRGRLETTFHRRMKDHACKDKVKLIRDDIQSDKVLCVHLVIPKKYMDEKQLRPWLLASESELIFCYSMMFGDAPRYNYQHRSDRTTTDDTSFSQQMVKMIKDESLEKFYDTI